MEFDGKNLRGDGRIDGFNIHHLGGSIRQVRARVDLCGGLKSERTDRKVEIVIYVEGDLLILRRYGQVESGVVAMNAS